jgi:hypothetical protein
MNRNPIPSHSIKSLFTHRPVSTAGTRQGVSSASSTVSRYPLAVRIGSGSASTSTSSPAPATATARSHPSQPRKSWQLSSTTYQVREKAAGRLRGCEVISFGMCGKNHGLCNLLFGLCTTLIRGWWHGSYVVVLDSVMRSDFANDHFRTVRTADMIDFPALREYCRSRYGVNLVLRDQVRVDVVAVRWGNRQKGFANITAPFKARFELHENPRAVVGSGEGFAVSDLGYALPRGTDLNALNGDPCRNTAKVLEVHLKVTTVFDDEWTVKVKHDEHTIQSSGVEWILRGEGSLPWNFAWINTIDSQKFDDLLEHITLRMPVGFSLPPVSGSVSVIHLRVEEDYIKHVATNLLKIPQQTYRNALVSAWCRSILTHIPRTDTVVVLTYLVQGNPVLAFMRQAGFAKVVILKKQPLLGREVNAAADLIAGVQLCNHVFIGCWNQKNLRGSTFSYVIARHLKARRAQVRIVFMDGEQITKNTTPEILSSPEQLR